MEAATTTKFSSSILLLLLAMLVSALADGGYGDSHSQPSSKPERLPTIPIPIPKPTLMPKQEHGIGGYGTTPLQKPEIELPKNIAVQGLVYCKSGPKLIPLKGAMARVTCLGVDKNGYESAPFSFSSCPADEKGYFTAKLPLSKLEEDAQWKVTQCKAFLENSPWDNCNVPADVNNGITGALLTTSRLLNGFNLYSVGPFIYTPHPQPVSKGGY